MLNFLGFTSLSTTEHPVSEDYVAIAIPVYSSPNPQNTLPGTVQSEVESCFFTSDKGISLNNNRAESQIIFSLMKQFFKTTARIFSFVDPQNTVAKVSASSNIAEAIGGLGLKNITFTIQFLYSYSVIRDTAQLVKPPTTGNLANLGNLSIKSIFPNAELVGKLNNSEKFVSSSGVYCLIDLLKLSQNYGGFSLPNTLNELTVDNLPAQDIIIQRIYGGLFHQALVRANNTASAITAVIPPTVTMFAMPNNVFDQTNPRIDLQANYGARVFFLKQYQLTVQTIESDEETIMPNVVTA